MRASVRTGWTLASLAGVLVLGLVLTASRASEDPAVTTLGPAVVILVAGVAYLAWKVEPAWLLSVAVFLSPLAGNWPELGIPGPLAPDRLLLVAAIGAVLLRAPSMQNRPPIPMSLIHWLMLAAVTFVAISAAAVGNLLDTDWFARLFDTFGITPFLMFVVAPFAFREPRQRAILLAMFVAFGAYLGLTTLFERVGLDPLVFPRYILDETYGIHYGRGRGPFVEAVTNGYALFVCLIACAIAYNQWDRSRRWIPSVVALLCLAGIVMTMQRSVWLATVVATLITVLTLRRNRATAIKTVLAAVIALTLALVAIPGLRTDIQARLDEQGTVHDRENLHRAAGNMIEARPLFGFGWGEFKANSPEYYEQADDYPLRRVRNADIHNSALSYAVELGLLGALLWAAVILLGVLGGVRRRGPPELDDWRVGLLAVAIAYAVISNFVPPQVFPNLALWTWIGVAWTRAPVSAADRPTEAAAHPAGRAPADYSPRG